MGMETEQTVEKCPTCRVMMREPDISPLAATVANIVVKVCSQGTKTKSRGGVNPD